MGTFNILINGVTLRDTIPHARTFMSSDTWKTINRAALGNVTLPQGHVSPIQVWSIESKPRKFYLRCVPKRPVSRTWRHSTIRSFRISSRSSKSTNSCRCITHCIKFIATYNSVCFTWWKAVVENVTHDCYILRLVSSWFIKFCKIVSRIVIALCYLLDLFC